MHSPTVIGDGLDEFSLGTNEPVMEFLRNNYVTLDDISLKNKFVW